MRVDAIPHGEADHQNCDTELKPKKNKLNTVISRSFSRQKMIDSSPPPRRGPININTRGLIGNTNRVILVLE